MGKKCVNLSLHTLKPFIYAVYLSSCFIAGNSGFTISSCYNIASVTDSGSSIGGIVGVNWHIVTNCYNKGEVAGTNTIGGIIGDNSDIVDNPYNNANC